MDHRDRSSSRRERRPGHAVNRGYRFGCPVPASTPQTEFLLAAAMKAVKAGRVIAPPIDIVRASTEDT
jgi:hypothetical protein